MDWWNAVLPVVTLALGYVGTLWTERRRDDRAADRAVQDRVRARTESKTDRRETFELETLTRARIALSDLGRAVSSVPHVDSTIRAIYGDRYSWSRAPEDNADRLAAAHRAVRDVQGLILHDPIREAVTTATRKAFELSSMRQAEHTSVEMSYVAFTDALNSAQDMISQRTRAIYNGSVTNP